MSTLASRLHECLAEKPGLTQADLARACGLKAPSVHAWFTGGTKSLKGNNLLKVSAFFGVNAAWLAEGKRPKYPGQVADAQPTQADRQVQTLLDKKTGIVTIFRYDTGGSMGGGIVLHDQPGVIESWQVSKGWLSENVRGYTSVDNLAIVTGFGDSMRPTYNPGDPLIVDKGITTVEFDSVYFFRIDDVGYVKRLQRIPTPNGLIIKALSDNRDLYEPFEIREGMNFEVLARVVQIWRREDY